MKNRILLLPILGALVLTTNANASILTVDDVFNIVSVNGDVVNSTEAKLRDGKNLIEIRYYDLYSDSPEHEHLIRSSSYFAIVSSSSNEKISILADNLYEEEDIRAFMKKPEVTLTSSKEGDRKLTLMDHATILAKLVAAKD